MVRTYDTRCWLCGSKELEADSRGVRCTSCGATYNVIPKPAGGTIAYREDAMSDDKTPSPSATVQRQTAKARKSKKEVANH